MNATTQLTFDWAELLDPHLQAILDRRPELELETDVHNHVGIGQPIGPQYPSLVAQP
jgi:hypothetical protein